MNPNLRLPGLNAIFLRPKFGRERGASHFLWLRGCGATNFPFEEVGPSHVFEATSDGEQCVGADFRPAAPRLFESAADDALAGVFRHAGSDRPKARLERRDVLCCSRPDARRPPFASLPKPPRSRLQSSNTDPDETRKRKISSNQRKWDAPCSQTASPVDQTIIMEISPPNLPYPVRARHSCLVLSNHQKSILHTSMARALFHADS